MRPIVYLIICDTWNREGCATELLGIYQTKDGANRNLVEFATMKKAQFLGKDFSLVWKDEDLDAELKDKGVETKLGFFVSDNCSSFNLKDEENDVEIIMNVIPREVEE